MNYSRGVLIYKLLVLAMMVLTLLYYAGQGLSGISAASASVLSAPFQTSR